MKLKLYKKRRNFQKTKEPKGKISHEHKNLYVIQKHAASHLHYDLRLELNGVLLSWAIPKGPCLDPTVKRLAVHVEDHPIEYGNFEGTIPKGEYGAGTVIIWDKGTWVSEDKNSTAAYKKGHLRFQLKGKKLKGRWSLIRFKSKDQDKSWFLIKSKDKYAQSIAEHDITLKKTKSIKMKLSRSSYPSFISPELATLVDKPPEGAEWIHEIKLDGYRIIAFLENKTIRLMSRNNKAWTTKFLSVAKAIKKSFNKNIIFDGEIVMLDENKKSNFQLLQNALDAEEDNDFVYYIFDILYYDQYDLRTLPLKERKELLRELFLSINSDKLLHSDYIVGTGRKVFKEACKMSLEGIISKNMNSLYEEKRTKQWLKAKCVHRQEFIIGGFIPSSSKREYFGSLFLGYYDKDKQLVYCGKVGTGFNQTSLNDIYQKLKTHIIKKNPFNKKTPNPKSAVWVKPTFVCEVAFSEWTDDGNLRHPSFKGLRLDKKATTIKKELELQSITFRLTHPDKILYPESKISKLNLAKYYEEIQNWILPYLINRPLTIVRCPENYKKCFYQKHMSKGMPDALYSISIKEKNKTDEYIYIKDLAGLMSLIQMGTLEIHPWGCKIDNIEYPDMITFDLDPAPDVAWKKVVYAAKNIRDYLKKYKLKSFVKTSGGKGLHIVIPIKPKYSWDIVKEFTHAFVNFLVEEHPDEYIGEMSKAKRKGKIFVDYLRNQRGATSIGAYSTRARPHAPVAVPLEWNELTHHMEDTTFTIKTLPQRLKTLKKDPWRDFLKIKQTLKLK